MSVRIIFVEVEGPRFVKVTVTVKLLVTCGELGDTVWETPRSAAGPMVVVNEEELFVVTKSVPAELVMVAVLERAPSIVGRNVTVRLAIPLVTIFPNVQVTAPLFVATVPCDVVAPTKEAPGGTASLTTVLDADEGP